MSKILEASCENGVVTAEGVVVPNAEILSSGIGASQGTLILDGDKAWYLPKASSNLETTLTQTISALSQIKIGLDKVASALPQLKNGALVGATAAEALGAAGAVAAANMAMAFVDADVTAISTASSGVEAAKEELQELEGELK
jgi:hypothetical protein